MTNRTHRSEHISLIPYSNATATSSGISFAITKRKERSFLILYLLYNVFDMSILKTRYYQLSFPLADKTAQGVLQAYCNEFGFSLKMMDVQVMIILFANALRDYLEYRIDGWVLEALSLEFIFYPNQEVYMRLKQNPIIFQLIFEITDFVWLEQSTNVADYKKYLKIKLVELVKYNIANI